MFFAFLFMIASDRFKPCFLTHMCFNLYIRDEHEPLYDGSLINGKSTITEPQSNALMSQDWEKDLMEAGLYL